MMKKKILTIVICAAALAAAGCGSRTADSAAAVTAEETAAAEEEQTGEAAPSEGEEESAGADTAVRMTEDAVQDVVNTQLSAAKDLYESEDGWSVRYNSELVDMEERQNSVRFTYNGSAAAANRIEISYLPNTSTDIVLADRTEDYDREDLERSEGYFAGQSDLWSFNVDEVSDGARWTHGFTAVEHNGGVLLVERNGSVESDEEQGRLISDTMAAILDTFEFSDHEPQEEYDYIPGRYVLEKEITEEEAKDYYPSYIVLSQNHKGRLGYPSPTEITWYSRDSILRENYLGGVTHYYNIEGERLYLQIGEEWVEYRKDLGAASSIESSSVNNSEVLSFKTYENEKGWTVYYDETLFAVKESWNTVDFVYGGEQGTEQLEITYMDDDSTDEVLADRTRDYDLSQVVKSEGYVGGRRDAWGYTVTVPCEEGGAGVYRKLTAVEHNGGTLLFDRLTAYENENARIAESGQACEEILNTFMFTDHDPEEEYDYIPGKYILNDKKLQKSASNYPSYIRLNRDHTGLFGGAEEQEIIWYSRDPVIKVSASGDSYSYHIEDETLYMDMSGEWVEFEKEEDD